MNTTKIVSILIFLLFGVFAVWQYNDPDPILWIIVYGSVALISLLRVFGIYSRIVTLIFTLALLIFALFHAPSFIEWLTTPNKEELFGKMIYDKPYVEGTREFLGLILGSLACFIQYRMK